MWNLAAMLVLLSLTGFYAMADKNGPAVIQTPPPMPIAQNMALYREAVITWFTDHPGDFNTSVPLATLTSWSAQPTWLALAQSPTTSIWRNYRDANGVIYIYAASLPPVNIVPDIVEMSQYSRYAGMFRTGDTTLFSPFMGDTQIALPAAVTFTNGSPIWVATIR